jgi:Methylase involved in ubiquinone/menaquinone biosynthesis
MTEPPDAEQIEKAVDLDAARVREEYARRRTDPRVARYYVRVGPAVERANASRRQRVLRELDVLGPRDTLRILDIGCGSGDDLAFLHDRGFKLEHLVGVDLLEEDVRRTMARVPGATLKVANAADLPFPDESFDATLQTTVLSSITDPDVRAAVAREMVRVTRATGLIISWDMRVAGTRNPHLVAIDEGEVRRLFGAAGDLEMFRTTLSIRISSRVGPRVASVLAHVPSALHHLVVVVRRGTGAT